MHWPSKMLAGMRMRLCKKGKSTLEGLCLFPALEICISDSTLLFLFSFTSLPCICACSDGCFNFVRTPHMYNINAIYIYIYRMGQPFLAKGIK